jgi:ABC-2 type transport system permease protein
MKGLTSVFRRELRGYFSTPLAYVFLVIFLFFSSYLAFQQNFFEMREASLRTFFQNMPLLFIFLGPALAMRLWAEERRTNSIELLFSLPVTVPQAVLGKFFAAWSVLVLALGLTFPMVLTVAYLGRPDPGPIAAGYVGSVLLAGAYLAIGSFFSSLTRSQVIAFVLAVVGCAAFLFAGNPSVTGALARVLPMGVVAAVEGVSFQSRFESILRGVIEVRDVAFFVLLTAGWLWATAVGLKGRMAAG